MARLPFAVLTTLLASGLAAPVVGAATVSIPKVPGGAEYLAAPGERNALVVSSAAIVGAPGGLRWTFRDEAATVTPGAGCAPVDVHTATCAQPGASRPTVRLGDGDDAFEGDTSADVFGEAGNDTIRLVDGDDPSTGTLSGGDGDDLLDASVAAKVSLRGGRGGDLLTGSDEDDLLDGGSGTDELRGGQGNDRLLGGPGPDRLSCGAGSGDATVLDASDRLLDPKSPSLGLTPRLGAVRTEGGSEGTGGARAQADDEATGGGRTQLRTDCENLGIATANATYRVDVWKSPAKLVGTTLSLGRRTSSARSGTLQLRDAQGQTLGTGSLRTKVLRVRLTPAGQQLLQPGDRATVKIVTRPTGTARSGTRGPGIEVDLTIAK